MENRHGLAMAGLLSKATGTAERRASDAMLAIRRRLAGRRIKAGEDKAYDTTNQVARLRADGVTPHVTQNNGLTRTGKRRRSAVDGRTTRHTGYAKSQFRRAMIECIFGWGKQYGTLRKPSIAAFAVSPATFCSTSSPTIWSAFRNSCQLDADLTERSGDELRYGVPRQQHPVLSINTRLRTPANNRLQWFFSRLLVLQLRMLTATVVRISSARLVTPSPS
jgi:hypothetical protein